MQNPKKSHLRVPFYKKVSFWVTLVSYTAYLWVAASPAIIKDPAKLNLGEYLTFSLILCFTTLYFTYDTFKNIILSGLSLILAILIMLSIGTLLFKSENYRIIDHLLSLATITAIGIGFILNYEFSKKLRIVDEKRMRLLEGMNAKINLLQAFAPTKKVMTVERTPPQVIFAKPKMHLGKYQVSFTLKTFVDLNHEIGNLIELCGFYLKPNEEQQNFQDLRQDFVLFIATMQKRLLFSKQDRVTLKENTSRATPAFEYAPSPFMNHTLQTREVAKAFTQSFASPEIQTSYYLKAIKEYVKTCKNKNLYVANNNTRGALKKLFKKPQAKSTEQSIDDCIEGQIRKNLAKWSLSDLVISLHLYLSLAQAMINQSDIFQKDGTLPESKKGDALNQTLFINPQAHLTDYCLFLAILDCINLLFTYARTKS